MKLRELFKEIGFKERHRPMIYDYSARGYIEGPEQTYIPSCHSKDKPVIANHMDDELPFYVRLGPICVFAIRIPTAKRYAYFTANSIGISQYQVSRYYHVDHDDTNADYGFARIKKKLLESHTFGSHESEEFKLFTTLSKIGGN